VDSSNKTNEAIIDSSNKTNEAIMNSKEAISKALIEAFSFKTKKVERMGSQLSKNVFKWY
jgi:hypothetical protein